MSLICRLGEYDAIHNIYIYIYLCTYNYTYISLIYVSDFRCIQIHIPYTYLNRKISTKVLQQMSQRMLQQLELVSSPCSGSRCAMCRMQVARVFLQELYQQKSILLIYELSNTDHPRLRPFLHSIIPDAWNPKPFYQIWKALALLASLFQRSQAGRCSGRKGSIWH